MAELKTKQTSAGFKKFLDQISDEEKRKDCLRVAQIMEEITGEKPKLWGAKIVGFGSYHYKYASGREGDAPITAFSPRKQNLTVYINPGFEQDSELMDKLGKHGKSCLYIKRLSDIHEPTLKKLIRESVKHTRKLALKG